jgi:hypothetical protein
MKKKIINILEQLLKWLKKEKVKVEAEVKVIESRLSEDARETANQAITDTQLGANFVCHYCHKGFLLLSQNIFPVSVRMLYKESYVQGKGVLCPHCGQTCITG